jgi:hypothetical protein
MFNFEKAEKSRKKGWIYFPALIPAPGGEGI